MDRPLTVRCNFDRRDKKIVFTSARNCSYEILRRKVEQCFGLSHTAYGISYKDDDGEYYDINTDSDLVEAIQYFQAGTDDPPRSSSASILSVRSVRSISSRKIVLQVQITVDYDGPISRTFPRRNSSEHSFSFGAPSVVDDDARTVSSHAPRKALPTPPRFDKGSQLSGESSWDSLGDPNNPPTSITARVSNPSEKSYPDESAVFARLKLQETMEDDTSSVDYDHLAGKDRGAAWLREQNSRTLQAMLADVLPPPSMDSEQLGGDLALERDPRGKYYYSYTATGSSGASQAAHEESSAASISQEDNYEVEPSIDPRTSMPVKPRPTSRQLNWLAAQQMATSERSENRPIYQEPSIPEDNIPAEFLPDYHLPPSTPPQEELTDCSECGLILNFIRYVCTTCGEKAPKSEASKDKGKDRFSHYSYPPKPKHLSHASSVPSLRNKHLSMVSEAPSFSSIIPDLCCPTTPQSYDDLSKPAPRYSSSGASILGSESGLGYELCAGCIESAGVTHAIEAVAPNTSPSSPEDAQRALQWRRSAPRHKGQLRHVYQEKMWGQDGWEDVEQDEYHALVCSACGSSATTPRNKLYKCASCMKYYLCRACYSQVHDMHPSHAFLAVPKPDKSSSGSRTYDEPSDEQSLLHVGIKCSHCMLEIVGARFHCAICDSVDICANCESAGLPGNLHLADGGHTSSHIMIKIPYPLERNEVQTASKRAMHLWTGRDAPSVLNAVTNSMPKPGTSEMSFAHTVMMGKQKYQSSPDDHHIFCGSCSKPIVGIRYQCAHCPSQSTSYSLCSSCELHSYIVHDPNHIFFKIPRPVQREIESPFPLLPKLYCSSRDFYLEQLLHRSALCDRCMTYIQGCWFRCAYCGIDLCTECEDMDSHDDTHIFIVFKSLINIEIFHSFADLGNPAGSPAVIKYNIYF
ncbi:hypothetical protein C8J56DRAFT_1008024 [Mycena floridula]|nr:hypothetical protein C8J56DRAFT_1008024 [Mycena floridula]